VALFHYFTPHLRLMIIFQNLDQNGSCLSKPELQVQASNRNDYQEISWGRVERSAGKAYNLTAIYAPIA
jgi:hypothetical protein